MAGATLAADGGLSDITSLLSLVKDSKTSSSTSTNISQAGVTQQINDILQSNTGLAAVAGAQKSAGLYNGSTNTLLTNDLLARASAQVAAKNATTTTTQTKKASVTKQNIEALLASQALKASLGSDAVKTGAKSAAGSIADELGISYGANDTATANALSSVSGAGPGAQAGDFAALEDSLGGQTIQNSVAAGSGDIASDVLGVVPGATADDVVAGSAAANISGDVVGGAATESAIAGGAADLGLEGGEAATAGGDLAAAGTAAEFADGAELGDAALEGGAAAGGEELGLAALGPYGLAAGAALYVGTKYGSQIDDSITQPGIRAVGDTLGDSLEAGKDLIHGDIGGSISAVGDSIKTGTGWIVCTELLRQGKFNKKHYVAGLKVFQSYPQHLLCGYYVWASPLVLYIRRNPSSWVTSVCRHLFGQRAEFLAARAGVFGARDTVYGQSISALMFGFCWILGHALNGVGKKEVLYGRT